ncbi:hypothetical protein [Sphingomonas profundi]|uniref:hypothetical protein n=1 Tax=Alterirhizorhabdus profundi TaxID=2681549 RepID=UPI0012E84804|nr:hypothetical protein [Sphingomonas profundi]
MSLDRLRQLCAEHWNPIGVPMAGSPEAAGLPFPPLPSDEYDTYLRRVEQMLDVNYSAEEISRYLAKVESEYLGLSAPCGDRDAFVAAAMANGG